MKTKQYFSLFVLFTAFLATSAQTGKYAMNMQSYNNRKPVTIQEKNNLRDNGILPAAVTNNPCASLAAVQGAATQVGADLRMGEISRAEIVRTEGYAFSQTPITWDNFGNVQAFLDEHTIIISVDYRNQKGELSCSKWANGVFKGTDWDEATVGVKQSFAWDFRKETGNPLAVFPYELEDCNNLEGKSLLLSVFNGTSKIGQPATAANPSNFSATPNSTNPNQGPTNPQTYVVPPTTGTTILNIYSNGYGGASTNTNTNTSPATTPVSASVPSITFQQAPTQMLPPNTSSTVQIAPGMAGYVTPVGTAANVSGTMVYGNAVAPATGGNTYISTFPVNGNGRPKANPAEIVMATNSTLNTVMHGAEFFGADNWVQNKLGTNPTVKVIYSLLTGSGTNGQIPNFTPVTPGTNNLAFQNVTYSTHF